MDSELPAVLELLKKWKHNPRGKEVNIEDDSPEGFNVRQMILILLLILAVVIDERVFINVDR